ncbi:MAG TPA: TonB family protein [Syntrophorhabdaceae bacterium]|mgnify:FL=1|nr:TonB family protein [Syntrophorhabdaceae bacterium]
MKEEKWFKWLVLSTVMHILVIGAFGIPIKKSSKKLNILSSYSVNLVGDPGLGRSGAGHISEDIPGPARERTEKKISKPVPQKKPEPARVKPKLERKEKEPAISLSKKKVPVKQTPVKETASKEELSRLSERIKEIRKRTDYLDVSQAKSGTGSGTGRAGGQGFGLSGSSDGGSRPMDPVSQQYILGIWEKIKNSWGLPGMSSFKKDLETIVTIRIRRDGRITDINVEKRSGNRVYDESILRVLRSVEPLPPIPASLNMDTIEIGFRFLPGDLS